MTILDFFFPKTCSLCGRWGEYLCSSCLNALSLVDNQICPECGKPSIGGKTHVGCQKVYGLDGLVSVFKYRGVIESLLGKYKFGFVSDVSTTLVEMIVTYTQWSYISQVDWLVVPVPLHVSRLRWRGFNQAELIAQGVAAYGGWYYSRSLLERYRKTKVQSLLSQKDRAQNMRKAFRLTSSMADLSQVNILLVDDVWTTGSTMKAAATPFKRAGAKRVWGLVLAS